MADLDIAALRKRMANYDAVHWPSISMPIEDVRALLDAAEENAQLRADLKAMEAKVITCGVAADHPDPLLTTTGSYYIKANSPQAERVRVVRADRDALRAQRDALVAAGERLIRATLMDTNSGAGIRKGWVEVRESQWDALFDERAPLVTLIRSAKEQL